LSSSSRVAGGNFFIFFLRGHVARSAHARTPFFPKPNKGAAFNAGWQSPCLKHSREEEKPKTVFSMSHEKGSTIACSVLSAHRHSLIHMASETPPEHRPEAATIAPDPESDTTPLTHHHAPITATSAPGFTSGVPGWVPSFVHGPVAMLVREVARARAESRQHTAYTLAAVGSAAATFLLLVISLALGRWVVTTDADDIYVSLRGSCAGTVCARAGDVCHAKVLPYECALLRAGIAFQILAAFGLISLLVGTVAHWYAWHSGVVKGERSTGLLYQHTTTWLMLTAWCVCTLGLVIWSAVAAKFKRANGSYAWGPGYGLNVFAIVLGICPIFLSVV
jgi:hypothetical protein